jgi:uncharacterized membrane protein YkvA (DUF1232 family)
MAAFYRRRRSRLEGPGRRRRGWFRPRWFRQEVLALYFAFQDKRTPLRVKILVFIALLYLVDPIDLIPDVIPVFGYLDDLVIVPLLLHLAFRWLPAPVREDCLFRARRQAKRLRLVGWLLGLVLIGMLVAVFFLGRHMGQNFH